MGEKSASSVKPVALGTGGGGESKERERRGMEWKEDLGSILLVFGVEVMIKRDRGIVYG